MAPASTPAQVVLASASPRRRELLAAIGVAVEVLAADIDESRLPGEAPAALVERLARAKAEAVWQRPHVRARGLPVLAADTLVVLGDDVLGKPADRAEALAMLARLSGRAHRVLTAVAVAYAPLAAGAVGALEVAEAHTAGEPSAPRVDAVLSSTEVRFRVIGAAEAAAYWATGEPRDKAGAYGIQGIGGIFAERIDGSFTGVMGLPVAETDALLRRAGVDTWARRDGGGAS